MTKPKKKNEILYFALRNNKLKAGLAVLLVFVVLTLIGPLLTDYTPYDYVGPGAQPPLPVIGVVSLMKYSIRSQTLCLSFQHWQYFS
jgi:hypothetical protein